MISDSFIRALPKTDLHVHLDGSIRIPTLIELARSQGVDLPTWTPDGLTDLVFKKTYNSLVEYLAGFQYTVAVLQTAEALEQIHVGNVLTHNLVRGPVLDQLPDPSLSLTSIRY